MAKSKKEIRITGNDKDDKTLLRTSLEMMFICIIILILTEGIIIINMLGLV